MKPYLSIVLLLVIFSSCSSENVDDKNKRNDQWAWWVDDATGKGSWIPVTNNNSTKENGRYTLFYFNGNVAEKGRMKAKKKVDTTFYFNLSGNADGYELHLSDTDKVYYYRDGAFKFFYLDGTLNGSGIIKNHRRGDKWKIYYKNGRLKYNKDLKDGAGFVSGYSENGKPEFIEYWNDSTHIYWVVKEWYESGSLKISGEIQNGNLNGEYKVYYPDGKIKKKIFYKDGKTDGAFQTFFENGRIEQEEIHKNGLADGEIKAWYNNGKPKIVGAMKNGMKNGFWTGFDENGKKLFTCEMNMGMVNGKLEKFDSTGKIISSKVYHNMPPESCN